MKTPGQPAFSEMASGSSSGTGSWSNLVQFSFPSVPGAERKAAERVALFARQAGVKPAAIERLKTAVAEATLNAIEHGNHYRPELLVEILVQISSDALRVQIADQGEGNLPTGQEPPQLEAKLAGIQPPRGWGMFLIEKMVDEFRIIAKDGRQVVELILYLHAGREGYSDK